MTSRKAETNSIETPFLLLCVVREAPLPYRTNCEMRQSNGAIRMALEVGRRDCLIIKRMARSRTGDRGADIIRKHVIVGQEQERV
jgi:hypothetical protein